MNCPRCDRSLSGRGLPLCEKHLAQARASYRRNSETSKAGTKRRRAEKLARGECYQCGGAAIPGRTRCAPCAESATAKATERYWSDPERYKKARKALTARTRRAGLLKKYGITPDDYDAMLVEQNAVCKICQRPETATSQGVVRSLAVDHDHESGEVRGLLCHRCNRVLGLLEDDVDLILRCAEYLQDAAMETAHGVLTSFGLAN